MITCARGSMPRIRSWRAAGVDAERPWNTRTHGRFRRSSSVGPWSAAGGRRSITIDPFVAEDLGCGQVGDEPVRDQHQVGFGQDLFGAGDMVGVVGIKRIRACGACPGSLR